MTMRGPDQAPITVIQSLYQLIDAIADGGLLIPAFPGPLIWSWDRQCALLQSVRDGIPIGAVTIWRTTHHVPSQTALAGHVLESPPAGFPHQYVLDGLRRLCTLFAALREVQPGDQPDAAVGYDLEDQVFLESFDATSRPQVIPLRALSNSVTLLRWQRQLRGDRAPVWARCADELAIAFRECNVAVTSLASNEFSAARRVLESTHHPDAFGEADLVHALTWAPRFNLRDQLEALRSQTLQPLGWGNLDFATVIQVVRIGSDLDPRDGSVEAVSALVKADPTVLERAFIDLVRAAELLRARCGILRWELMPYAAQAVLIADALSKASDRDVQDLLVDWFWMTTYGEMFTGLDGHQLRQAIRDLRQAISGGQLRGSGSSPLRLRPLPRSPDLDEVRAKSFAFTLARELDHAGSTRRAASVILAEHGAGALFPLVPLRLVDGPRFSSAGNHFLCHPTQAVELGARLLSAQLSDDERAAHVVPDAALDAARRGNWNEFVALRTRELAASEQAFFAEVLARHPAMSSLANA